MIMSQEISIAVIALIGLSNCLVGGLIGICGIAGFLLPIFYTGALGYTVDMALAYSFLAFLVSGILGSVNYKRAGNLDIPMSLRLGIGSFVGAVAGVISPGVDSKNYRQSNSVSCGADFRSLHFVPHVAR